MILAACAALACAQTVKPTPPPDTIEQRARPCTVCHGKEGRATPEGYFPRIAGKPAGYLFNQLVNFRDGHRNFPMMTYLVERQSDAFLAELAEYFGSLKLPYATPPPPKVSEAVLARGQKLVTEGDAAVGIPACNACHGKSLLGVLPAVPGLLGLSTDYITAQLGAWKSGNRRAPAPDCMAEIAQRLQSEDIAALAAWLALQRVPADAGAQPSFDEKPPLACGSIAGGAASE